MQLHRSRGPLLTGAGQRWPVRLWSAGGAPAY